jgi:hypothetical protein
LVLVALILGGATATWAQKPVPDQSGSRAWPTAKENLANPVVRQGGETILDAVAITPFSVYTGTTAGYADDYDEACPYEGSTSPDVVYSIVCDADTWLFLDLWGSAYDTKVYVYDEALDLLGCNDDFYADYTSRLEFCAPAGMTCFIVIDGYGGAYGDYVLDIYSYCSRCDLVIPADAVDEGEPWPPAGDWLDCFNGGCPFLASCDPAPWQVLAGDAEGQLVFHGLSGFARDDEGPRKDWDWFAATIGPTGVITIEADAEVETGLWVMAPLDCDDMEIVQSMIFGACDPWSLSISGTPGDLVWLYAGPMWIFPPTCDPAPFIYDYLLQISGLQSGPVAVERRDWSSVKALFR